MKSKISKVSQDILDIKFSKKETFNSALNKFFSVMRKNKIKRGTRTKNGGIAFNNPEWQICWTLFLVEIESFFQIGQFDFEDTPKDLRS